VSDTVIMPKIEDSLRSVESSVDGTRRDEPMGENSVEC
jgi:hypothetical protein